MRNEDKHIEKNRYDKNASVQLEMHAFSNRTINIHSVPAYLEALHLIYYNFVISNVRGTFNVLELGSGCGTHTKILLETGASVCASDISYRSLKIVKIDLSLYKNLIFR
jgi:methylase of polypeptide subunit release factors